MLVTGSCHCGNIRFQLKGFSSPAEIPARACDCSFCTKHGAVWTSCPTGELAITIQNPDFHSRYAFATETSVFHICSRCGAVPVVTCEVDANIYAVVNVNTMEGIDTSLFNKTPATFTAEDKTTRLARRKANWIGRVSFTGA
jgi:hypothetical protein